MVPTGLVIHPDGEFEIHFETVSGTYFLDGYWPSAQFNADGTIDDFTIEG